MCIVSFVIFVNFVVNSRVRLEIDRPTSTKVLDQHQVIDR
jgi:hypothetical protein